MKPLFPPYKQVSGFHIIGQDSPTKGTRLVEVHWDAYKQKWIFPKNSDNGIVQIRSDLKQCWKYSPKELGDNNWVYVEEGKL
jgi:hypothetical protein